MEARAEARARGPAHGPALTPATPCGPALSILRGRRNRKLLWAATAASILPLATVYCAPTSMLAGVLGLLAAILPAPGGDGDPGVAR